MGKSHEPCACLGRRLAAPEGQRAGLSARCRVAPRLRARPRCAPGRPCPQRCCTRHRSGNVGRGVRRRSVSAGGPPAPRAGRRRPRQGGARGRGQGLGSWSGSQAASSRQLAVARLLERRAAPSTSPNSKTVERLRALLAKRTAAKSPEPTPAQDAMPVANTTSDAADAGDTEATPEAAAPAAPKTNAKQTAQAFFNKITTALTVPVSKPPAPAPALADTCADADAVVELVLASGTEPAAKAAPQDDVQGAQRPHDVPQDDVPQVRRARRLGDGLAPPPLSFSTFCLPCCGVPSLPASRYVVFPPAPSPRPPPQNAG
jgi:hypothetical protein